MIRRVLCLLLLLPACSVAEATRGPEVVDPQEAQAHPDFSLQGEYLGKGVFPGGESKVGAQVIARGEGDFRVVLYRGGLPGAGWHHRNIWLIEEE